MNENTHKALYQIAIVMAGTIGAGLLMAWWSNRSPLIAQAQSGYGNTLVNQQSGYQRLAGRASVY